MKWAVSMLALASAPSTRAAETADDPQIKAITAYAAALQDEAFLIGVCEGIGTRKSSKAWRRFWRRHRPIPSP